MKERWNHWQNSKMLPCLVDTPSQTFSNFSSSVHWEMWRLDVRSWGSVWNFRQAVWDEPQSEYCAGSYVHHLITFQICIVATNMMISFIPHYVFSFGFIFSEASRVCVTEKVPHCEISIIDLHISVLWSWRVAPYFIFLMNRSSINMSVVLVISV